ncbi:MAG: tRNA dihydrouridine synthase DusB [bacterium]|nr:tRNA dihydrouridine synthase DusB [bacterium]MCP4800961.1 tRNA dihydrouridine synthase DusB [bacterium]
MLERKKTKIDSRVDWFEPVRRVLSPMAGVTDRSFRNACRPFGAQLAFCEFTAAKGLIYDSPNTWKLVDTQDEVDPVGVQLFGNEPEALASAARLMRGKRLDILDLNFGCPAKKVVKKCGGSALLSDLPLLEEITKAVVEASPVPVSAKIRTGWDEESINYIETGLLLQEAGVCWVTLHGRSRAQKYRGEANWDAIAELVAALDIPVIGNGDVVDGESFIRMCEHTKCHAVMVGRGAIGNPWLFSEMEAADRGEETTKPSLDDILDVVEIHIADVGSLRGEVIGSRIVRKHIARYIRGFEGAAAIRRELYETDTAEEMLSILREMRSK